MLTFSHFLFLSHTPDQLVAIMHHKVTTIKHQEEEEEKEEELLGNAQVLSSFVSTQLAFSFFDRWTLKEYKEWSNGPTETL